MSPFIHDDVLDNLSSIASAAARRIDICDIAEPTTYTEATSTNTAGNKTGLALTAITNGAIDGRRVSTPAITDGNVTKTSTTVGWWGLTDAAAVLHAAGALTAGPYSVTNLNTFTLDAIDITNRDAA